MISSFFLACFALCIISISFICAHFLVKDYIASTYQPFFSLILISIFLAGTLVTIWQTEPFPFVITKSVILFLLSISLFTDLQALLLAPLITLYPIPFVLLGAYTKLLPLSLLESIIGFLFAYSLLWSIDMFMFKFTKQHALGEGDRDLLAFIGSCTGFFGAWFSLMFGSLIGSFIGLSMYSLGKPLKNYQFPFGSFLVLGTVIYFLFEKIIVSFF